jgi:hypothetical protein
MSPSLELKSRWFAKEQSAMGDRQTAVETTLAQTSRSPFWKDAIMERRKLSITVGRGLGTSGGRMWMRAIEEEGSWPPLGARRAR